MAAKMIKQYRLRWKRVGLPEKRRIYWLRPYAEKRALLLGPEPWRALGHDGDEIMCCNGRECNCGGQTWREHMLEVRASQSHDGIPAIEYIAIDERTVEVGEWKKGEVG
jgi:hypothetical protein